MLVVFATMCALLVVPPLPCPVLYLCWLLGGSCDLVSKVISTLIGVISIATLIITLVTKSHDPLSMCQSRSDLKAWTWVERESFQRYLLGVYVYDRSEPYHGPGLTSKARPDPDP